MLYRMNRRLYHTLKIFFKLTGQVILFLCIMWIAGKGAELAIQLWGSPLPVIVLFIIVILGLASYQMSSYDVLKEEQEKERTEQLLKKDWENV